MGNALRRPTLLLAIILTFAATFQLGLFSRTFERNAEGCGAFFGLAARNYFRFPLRASMGLPVISLGRGASAVIYANHPPTTPLLIAAVHALSGYRGGYEAIPGEWQSRLPTMLFTLGCIALIYKLLRDRNSPRAGLIAAALFASVPMTLMFGGFPDVINPQLLFFAMLTISFYERFWQSPSLRAIAPLCLAFLGAAIMDWPAFLIGPVLGIHFISTKRWRSWGWIVGFGVYTIVVFAAIYAFLAVAQGNWRWMTHLVERRSMSSASDTPGGAFGAAMWLSRAFWDFAVGRHTLVVVILAIAWVVCTATRRLRSDANRFAALLLAWGLLHVVVGRQGVYQHEWWWWPITPGLCVAAGLMIDAIFARIISRQRANWIAIACLIVFAAVNCARVTTEILLRPPLLNNRSLSFSPWELGRVIRQHVAPDEVALVADSDQSLALWYYADRAMRRYIWSAYDVEHALHDDHAELCFGVEEEFTGRSAAVIVPKIYISSATQPLIDYLDARYSKEQTSKFLIYRVSQHRE